jgi:cytochrome c oxidase cbb3-type subunit 4
MVYEDIVHITGTWGLLYMIAIFAVAVTYALWPSNRAKFDRAARLPLDESARPPERGERR